jgi:DNA-binding MarR family transcriptional regulator
VVPGRADARERLEVDPVTTARLWHNPCWFAFRFNYIALRYNIPLYGWIEREYGLRRPEYVVVYSLGLRDGVTARDISLSYGFPKNSLSRAINALEAKGLIARRRHPEDKRSFVIKLTPGGRALFDATLPRFIALQDEMLKVLSAQERETLSVLLARIVLGTFTHPTPQSLLERVDAMPGAEVAPRKQEAPRSLTLSGSE